MSVGLSEAILNTYVGKKISEICVYHYHGNGPNDNHCAHFVSHVLGLGNRAGDGETCANLTVPDKGLLTKESITGSFIRVDELFKLCSMSTVFPAATPPTTTPAGAAAATPTVPPLTMSSSAAPAASSVPVATATSAAGLAMGVAAAASSAPPDECLVYVTLESNVDLTKQTMGDSPSKHVGIYFKGKIWQYGKTLNQVAVMTPADFAAIYAKKVKKGQKTTMVYTDFPSGASAASLATAKAVKAIPASYKKPNGKLGPPEIWYDGIDPKLVKAAAIPPLTKTTSGASAATGAFPTATSSSGASPTFRKTP